MRGISFPRARSPGSSGIVSASWPKDADLGRNSEGGADIHGNNNALRSAANGYDVPRAFRYGRSQTKTVIDADGVSPCINDGGHDGIAKLMIRKQNEENPQD